MAQIDMPSIGAIIPTVRGRKIAYAIFSIISLVVGNAIVFASTAYGNVPLWLIASGAVVANTAPIFGGIAIANATEPVSKVDIPEVVPEVVPVVEAPVPGTTQADGTVAIGYAHAPVIEEVIS